ncbi:MAG TPA: prephenate dehydrogenase/arogenate dehydrogenase family protein [Candidatus Eremiobacteraceae bacterium]|jgi:prephenate dehydrogenase|nr:prephenate dehydrogenase/arogenate dehydrogenase family protein [Candidatus Eremiobacteraceae bacterium]
MTTHVIQRISILGTGLIGGSFALALRKYATDLHITGWDRPDVARTAQDTKAFDEMLTGDLTLALRSADLIYVALPIGATIDLLLELARHAPRKALITDACSTKLRISQGAQELFAGADAPLFLPGHPMAGREHAGIAHADADLFQNAPYALIADLPGEGASSAPPEPRGTASEIEIHLNAQPERGEVLRKDARVDAFLKLLKKVGARPLWLGARQHDYAVGLASHLPQLVAVALASFLYDRLDENGLPITVAGPGLRDTLRLAGSPYSTWRDIVLTNREVLSASLDLLARRIDDLRERLATRELEADFDAANELYRLLRSL